MGRNLAVAGLQLGSEGGGRSAFGRGDRNSGARRRSNLRWAGAYVAFLSAVCTVVTAAFVVVPSLRFGYRSGPLHVALETAAALIALLAAFLAFGRVEREGRLADAVLVSGFGALAVTDFALRAVPAVVGERADPVFVWAAVGGRFAGAVLLTTAAFAPARRLIRPRRGIAGAAVASLLVTAVAVLVAALLREHLPAAPSAVRAAEVSARHPDLAVHPAFFGTQLGGALLYLAAAFGFARRAGRDRDDFFRWLALASVLAIFSRVNYFLYPSTYTNWVYLGDVFRLGFFVLVLVAVLSEIAGYWRVAAAAAALDERRRLARDLHDGLAQELAFLTRNLAALGSDDSEMHLPVRLRAAADRAERESRQLLMTLSPPTDDEPAVLFEVLLRETVTGVAAREGVLVDLDVAAPVRLDHAQGDALLRIAAEGVTNAARHAGVDRVEVRLDDLRSRLLRLRIRDEGVGFDVGAASEGGSDAASAGFGLKIMRQRASAVGASFSIAGGPGRGTTIEVVFEAGRP